MSRYVCLCPSERASSLPLHGKIFSSRREWENYSKYTIQEILVCIPSSRAISHACCPPAPPKGASLGVGRFPMPTGYDENEGGKDVRQQTATDHNELSTHICSPVAYPRASVRARMGRHMVSLATLMKLEGGFEYHSLIGVGKGTRRTRTPPHPSYTAAPCWGRR